jgi:hypothetical protein
LIVIIIKKIKKSSFYKKEGAMKKIEKSESDVLEWYLAIHEVKHQEGIYPVFEWAYGTGKGIAFLVHAWPQGYLTFKESREAEDEAFKTGNVEEMLIWMKQVKNWDVEPPHIREVFGTILETRVQFGRIEHKNIKDLFKLLWDKLRPYCPMA